LLPPLRDQPTIRREDPRESLWRIYKQMRDRGQVPQTLQARIEELEAENAQLRSALAGSPTALTPALSDIVPPGEIGECYAGGPRPGPDDPPKRQPLVIEGNAARSPGAPAPQPAARYDYNKNDDWRDYVEPDGSIRSTPLSCASSGA
jgi:hypothetical protein